MSIQLFHFVHHIFLLVGARTKLVSFFYNGQNVTTFYTEIVIALKHQIKESKRGGGPELVNKCPTEKRTMRSLTSANRYTIRP